MEDRFKILIDTVLQAHEEESVKQISKQLPSIEKALSSKGLEGRVKIGLDVDVSSIKNSVSSAVTGVEQQLKKSFGTLNGVKLFDTSNAENLKKQIQTLANAMGKLQGFSTSSVSIGTNSVGTINTASIKYFNDQTKETVSQLYKINAETGRLELQSKNLSQNYAQITKELEKSASSTASFYSKIGKELANINSATLSRNNPLTVGTEQYDTYKAEFDKVSQYINNLKTDYSSLSDAQKIEVTEMVNNLKILAKEQQSSLYTANKLSAKSVTDNVAIEQTNLNVMEERLKKLSLLSGQTKEGFDALKLSLEKVKTPEQLQQYTTQLKVFEGSVKLAKSEQDGFFAKMQANTAKNNLQSWVERNSRVLNNSKLSEQFYKINQSLSEVGSSTDMQKVNKQIRDFKAEAESMGLVGDNVFSKLGKNVKQFISYLSATTLIYAPIRALREMVSTVTEIDTGMTELKKVTEETDKTYSKFLTNASDRAAVLGTKISELVDATASFARMGYSIEEASELGELATIYNNVGDGINGIDDASQSLISTMKAFNISADESVRIVDVFNEIGNRFAVTSGEAGNAMQRAGSALASGNNSLEQSVALWTAMNEILQDGDVAATSLKFITQRMRNTAGQLQEMGEDAEGAAESVTQLQQQIKDLTGVDIMLDADTFRATYDVLKDISNVWDDISDKSQADVIRLMAGTRQASAFSALMTNFSAAENALSVALDSSGSAMQEHDRWLTSIEAKTKQFQASQEKLAQTVVNSDFVKFLIDIGTVGTKAIDTLIDKVGLLTVALSSIGGIWVVKSGGLPQFFKQLKTAMTGVVDIAPQAEQAIKKFNQYADSGNIDWGKFTKTITKNDDVLTEYLRTTKSGEATLSGYIAYLNAANASTKALGVGSKVAAVGVKVLQTALVSVGIGLVMLAISAVAEGIMHIANASKKAAEETKEFLNEYERVKDSTNDNIKTLQNLKAEYDELAKGVSDYGDNVSLSESQYDRYLSIVKQVVDISPKVVKAYDAEGKAIVAYKGLVDEAIESQEDLLEDKKSVYLGKGDDIFEAAEKDIKDSLKDAKKLMKGIHSLKGETTDPFYDAVSKYVTLSETVGEKIARERGYAYSPGKEDKVSKLTTLNAEQVRDIVKYREAIVAELEATGKVTEENIESIDSILLQLEDIDFSIDDSKSNIKDYFNEYLPTQDWYADIPTEILPNFSEQVSEIIYQAESFEGALKKVKDLGSKFVGFADNRTYKALQNLKSQLDRGTLSTKEYKDAVTQLWRGLRDGDPIVADMIQLFLSFGETAKDESDKFSKLDFNWFDESFSGEEGLKSLTESVKQLDLALANGIITQQEWEHQHNLSVIAIGNHTESMKALNTEVDGMVSTGKELYSVYEQVGNGQKLSIEQTINLLNKYPELISYYNAETNALEITQQALINLWNVKKKAFEDSIYNNKKEAESARDNAKAQLAAINAMVEANFGKMRINDRYAAEEHLRKIREARKIIAEAEKYLNGIAVTDIVVKSSLTDFKNVSKVTEGINSVKNSANSAKDNIDSLNNSLKDLYDRLKELQTVSALDKLNDSLAKLNDKIANINENQDKYKQIISAINKASETRIEELNKERDAIQAKYDEEEKVNESLERQTDLMKKRSALENARRQKNVLLFDGGNFKRTTNQADVILANEEYLQSQQAIKDAEREAQLQSDLAKIDKRIKAIEDYAKRFSDIIQNYEDKQNLQLAFAEFKVNKESQLLSLQENVIRSFVSKVETSLKNLDKYEQDKKALEDKIKKQQEKDAAAEKQKQIAETKAQIAEKSKEVLKAGGTPYKPSSSSSSTASSSSSSKASSTSKVQYYAKYSGNSYIQDALYSLGEDGSYSNRAKIAKANGITGYVGSQAQNDLLLKLLKQGKLKKYYKGGRALEDTIWAGDIPENGYKHGEVITKARNSKIYDALESGRILENIKSVSAMLTGSSEGISRLDFSHMPNSGLFGGYSTNKLSGLALQGGKANYITINNPVFPNVKTEKDANEFLKDALRISKIKR